MKKLKILFVSILASAMLFLGVGLPVGVSAETAVEPETSIETSIPSDEVVSDEQTTDTSDTSDNVEDVWGDLTLEEVKDIVDEYIESKTDKETGKVDLLAILKDIRTWIVAGIAFLISNSGGAIFAWVLSIFRRKKEMIAQDTLNRVAEDAANKATEKVVGTAINVDISAEVSNSVSKELVGMRDNIATISDGVKNTEMLVADVAIAQSKSRLLSDEEQEQLRVNAESVRAHAGKNVVSPAKIKIEAVQSTAKNEEVKATKAELLKKNKPFINFDKVGGGS